MTRPAAEKLADFFSRSNVFSYRKGEVIIRSDDIPQGVYFLQEGYIKMNSLSQDGRELTLNIFKPGTYFPMMWALADIPNTYYFQAMTSVRVRRMPRNLFKDFINLNPDILKEFTVRILIGLEGTLTNIQYMLSGNSYHRVTSAISLFSRRFGIKSQGGYIIVNLPLTHQDIADAAGITRETASLAIKKLQDKGIILHHYRRLTVKRPDLLNRESAIDYPADNGEEAI
jgi:CRP-like cAMP-binding protein